MIKKTPFQQIAARIAEIANHRARLLQADRIDLPADLQKAMRSEFKYDVNGYDLPGNDEAETRLRNQFAEDHIKLELDKLKHEAVGLGITVEPELVVALMPSLAVSGEWLSSSYSC